MAQPEKKHYVDIADDFKNRCLDECGGALVVEKEDIKGKNEEESKLIDTFKNKQNTNK